MYLVGMDIRKLYQGAMITFVDASPIRQIPAEVELGEMKVGKREFSLIALGKKIKDLTEQKDIKRIVIDPLTTLSIQYADETQRRTMILDLVDVLSQTGATCLMTEDLRVPFGGKNFPTEDYSVHGVIHLRPLRVGKSLVKTIQVVKMRETSHDDQARIYKITDEGITVFPEENVFALGRSRIF
jgi:KaiC/GvpD/RAD55 family RecA-like ATPase